MIKTAVCAVVFLLVGSAVSIDDSHASGRVQKRPGERISSKSKRQKTANGQATEHSNQQHDLGPEVLSDAGSRIKEDLRSAFHHNRWAAFYRRVINREWNEIAKLEKPLDGASFGAMSASDWMFSCLGAASRTRCLPVFLGKQVKTGGLITYMNELASSSPKYQEEVQKLKGIPPKDELIKELRRIAGDDSSFLSLIDEYEVNYAKALNSDMARHQRRRSRNQIGQEDANIAKNTTAVTNAPPIAEPTSLPPSQAQSARGAVAMFHPVFVINQERRPAEQNSRSGNPPSGLPHTPASTLADLPQRQGESLRRIRELITTFDWSEKAQDLEILNQLISNLPNSQ